MWNIYKEAGVRSLLFWSSKLIRKGQVNESEQKVKVRMQFLVDSNLFETRVVETPMQFCSVHWRKRVIKIGQRKERRSKSGQC